MSPEDVGPVSIDRVPESAYNDYLAQIRKLLADSSLPVPTTTAFEGDFYREDRPDQFVDRIDTKAAGNVMVSTVCGPTEVARQTSPNGVNDYAIWLRHSVHSLALPIARVLTNDRVLVREIHDAFAKMTAKAGDPVAAFAWLRDECKYSHAAEENPGCSIIVDPNNFREFCLDAEFPLGDSAGDPAHIARSVHGLATKVEASSS